MNWLVPVLAGAGAGVLSGFGVGGGTLLLLWLTMVQGMGQLQAGGINLVYFAACALPALWGHLRRGLVDSSAALWSALAGAPACVAASLAASQLEVTLLRRAFGIFLLAVGLRELFSKTEPEESAHKSAKAAHTTSGTQPGQDAGKSTQKG